MGAWTTGLTALAAVLLAASTARAGASKEQMAFADDVIVQMKASSQSVRVRLGAARGTRDVVRTACLNDKLTQLEGVQRRAEDARSDLRRASLREDMDAIAAAAASMSRLDARAKELRREADQCVGEELAYAAMRDERRLPMRAHEAPTENAYEETVVTAGTTSAGDSTPAFQPAPPAPSPPPATPLSAAPAGGVPGPAAPFAPTPAPSGSPFAADASHEATMLAYSANLTLAVFQVDKSLGAVETTARELGGYLAQRGDAQVTVRVPRPRFDEAMGRIEKLGDVVHRNVAAEDVTDEFVDLELRLKNARAMRDQLADLLKGAAVKDAVEIEKELAKVTEVIEQIEGRLKVLRDKVGYSSITVSFQASAPSPVRSTAILPFTWLDTLGLEALLNVPKVSP
jgi:hypothetical protein